MQNRNLARCLAILLVSLSFVATVAGSNERHSLPILLGRGVPAGLRFGVRHWATRAFRSSSRARSGDMVVDWHRIRLDGAVLVAQPVAPAAIFNGRLIRDRPLSGAAA